MFISSVSDEKAKNKLQILWDSYHVAMYNTAFSVVHDEHDAEDVLLEVFTYYASHADKIPDPNTLRCKTMVCRLTKQRAINMYNGKKKHYENTETVEDMDSYTDIDTEWEHATVDMITKGDRQNAVRRALASLPDELYSILYQHYFLGIPMNVIADKMGCTTDEMKAKARKAKRHLLKKYKELTKDDRE